MSISVLVVGARKGSLGEAVEYELNESVYTVHTAGINGEEHQLNLVGDAMSRIAAVLATTQPKHIVCTVGINEPEPPEADPHFWYMRHFAVNVSAPMRLLRAWAVGMAVTRWDNPGHFVAISSNSATIPRTGSAAYCASKAALSQALRVKAREAVGGDQGYIVYGYEPGLLEGTPMTRKTEADFEGLPLHRMRGTSLMAGVPTAQLAAQIVAGLRVPGAALNGATIRYDGGEL